MKKEQWKETFSDAMNDLQDEYVQESAAEESQKTAAHKRKKTVAGLMLGLAAFCGTEKPPYFLAAVSVMSSGVAVFYAIYFGLAKDLNPPEFSGIATGLLNMTTFIGASVFPVLFGSVLNQFGRTTYGYRMAYRFMFVIAVIMLLLCLKAKETGMRNRWQDIRNGTF